jgi:hypothetical protein
MNLTKRAIWAILCLFAVYGCSGNGGSGDGEVTGSSEEPVTYCGNPTVSAYNVTGSAVGSTATASVSGTVSVVLPSSLTTFGGTPGNFTAQISLTVDGLPCAYNYPLTCFFGSCVYENPANACNPAHGICPSVCPSGSLPANYQFTNAYNVTLRVTRQTAGSYDLVSAAFQSAPLPANTPCDSYACSGGAVQTINTPIGGACPSDGNLCNGVEACDGAGSCVSNNPLPVNTPCSDGNVCDVATCNSSHTCALSSYAASGTPATSLALLKSGGGIHGITQQRLRRQRPSV